MNCDANTRVDKTGQSESDRGINYSLESLMDINFITVIVSDNGSPHPPLEAGCERGPDTRPP